MKLSGSKQRIEALLKSFLRRDVGGEFCIETHQLKDILQENNIRPGDQLGDDIVLLVKQKQTRTGEQGKDKLDFHRLVQEARLMGCEFDQTVDIMEKSQSRERRGEIEEKEDFPPRSSHSSHSPHPHHSSPQSPQRLQGPETGSGAGAGAGTEVERVPLASGSSDIPQKELVFKLGPQLQEIYELYDMGIQGREETERALQSHGLRITAPLKSLFGHSPLNISYHDFIRALLRTDEVDYASKLPKPTIRRSNESQGLLDLSHSPVRSNTKPSGGTRHRFEGKSSYQEHHSLQGRNNPSEQSHLNAAGVSSGVANTSPIKAGPHSHSYGHNRPGHFKAGDNNRSSSENMLVHDPSQPTSSFPFKTTYRSTIAAATQNERGNGKASQNDHASAHAHAYKHTAPYDSSTLVRQQLYAAIRHLCSGNISADEFEERLTDLDISIPRQAHRLLTLQRSDGIAHFADFVRAFDDVLQQLAPSPSTSGSKSGEGPALEQCYYTNLVIDKPDNDVRQLGKSDDHGKKHFAQQNTTSSSWWPGTNTGINSGTGQEGDDSNNTRQLASRRVVDNRAHRGHGDILTWHNFTGETRDSDWNQRSDKRRQYYDAAHATADTPFAHDVDVQRDEESISASRSKSSRASKAGNGAYAQIPSWFGDVEVPKYDQGKLRGTRPGWAMPQSAAYRPYGTEQDR